MRPAPGKKYPYLIGIVSMEDLSTKACNDFVVGFDTRHYRSTAQITLESPRTWQEANRNLPAI